METFVTIVFIIILGFIGKYIYDTYLSKNTEKNFEKFRNKDPIAAAKLQHPKTSEEFNDLVQAKVYEIKVKNDYLMESIQEYGVRKDGIYLFRHEGVSQYGEPLKLTMLFLFNSNNRVLRMEWEGFGGPDLEVLQSAIDAFANTTDLERNIGEFSSDNEKITMEFKNSNTHSEVYSGSIVNDGLILTRYLHLWDVMINEQNIKVSLQNMNFEFTKAQ